MNNDLWKKKYQEIPVAIILEGHTGPQNQLMGIYLKKFELKNNFPIYKHQFNDYYIHKTNNHLIVVYNKESLTTGVGGIRISKKYHLENEIIYCEYYDFTNFWEHDQDMTLKYYDEFDNIIINPTKIIIFGHVGIHSLFMGQYNITNEIINDKPIFKNIYYDYYIYKSSYDDNWLMTYNKNDITNNIGGIKSETKDNKIIFLFYTNNNTWQNDETINYIYM